MTVHHLSVETTRSLRAARVATTAVFFVTGAVFASWAARIPAVQDRLGLSPGELAVAILGIEGGAVLGLPLGGTLAARFGSRAGLRFGFSAYCCGMAAIGLAPGLAWLTAALAITAAAISINDVCMNVQGIELEARRGQPVLSGMHAGHSFGVLGGAVLGAGAAAAGIGVREHFTAVALAGLIAGLAATRWLLEERREPGRPRVARPNRRLAGLAAVAFCAFLIDGTAINWSAVHLRAEGAGPALAAAAFAAFALAVALGRLAGDRLLARFGRGRVVRSGGAVALAGCVAIVAATGPAAALGGWAVLGLGVAVIAPAVLGAAPAAGSMSAPAAVAAVTTVGYLGSFTGPPAVGGLAELVGVSASLSLMAVACVAVIALAIRAAGGS
jgi:MFS family permease